MGFLGLSLVTWQTLLIISFPFIYGSQSRIKRFLLFLRNPFKRSTSESTTTDLPPAQKITFRQMCKPSTLFLVFLIFLLILHSVINNPAQHNIFKLTNQRLNVPSTTLATALTRYYRSKGFTDMPAEQDRLWRKLNTLDARLLYTIIGPDAFLNCIWCRPPSSKKSTNGADHLVYTLTRLGFQYSVLLILLGLMTTGANQINAKRRVWRSRLAFVTTMYFVLETTVITMIAFLPTVLTSMDGGRMVWDSLFFLRTLVFSFVLIAAWWSVITEVPKDPISALSKLGIGVATVASELDGLVNRLRLTALQRSALMRDCNFRTQTNRFWENAESQAKLAGSNESVQSLKDSMGLSLKQHENRDQLRSWIQQVYPDPSFTTKN